MQRGRVQSVVSGAGVVGLAVARALSRSGREVLVLEAESAHGTGTSSRNSEVVHAGIYYTPGSMRAQACVQGRRMLYEYCKERGVEHKQCGKLIVATSVAQLEELQKILAVSQKNGLVGPEALKLLSPEEAIGMEPQVRCTGALYSPSTGIVNSHELMLALLADAEGSGAMLALKTPVNGGELMSDGRILLRTPEMEIECDEFVICSGLAAPRLASQICGFRKDLIPISRFAKGNYYALQGRSPFSRLVYPVPEAAGLGVHATIDLGGQCRFGPDVEWVEPTEDLRLNYDVNPQRAEHFYAEVRKYWPSLPDNVLAPDYCGIRPKLQRAGHDFIETDFMILTPQETGHRGIVCHFGIESPGLTACLFLGEYTLRALERGLE